MSYNDYGIECYKELVEMKFPKNIETLKKFKVKTMQSFVSGEAREKEEDFSGCYVLFDNEKAIYVGISRKS